MKHIEIKYPLLYSEWGDIGIVHLPDLHVIKQGFHEKKLLQKLAEIELDLVVVTGDLSQWGQRPDEAISLISNMVAPMGVFSLLFLFTGQPRKQLYTLIIYDLNNEIIKKVNKMTLQEKIKSELKVSMKEKNETKTSALRVLIGEFQRQPKKDLTDNEVIGIIRKLIKSEIEILSKSGQQSSGYMEVLEVYMPKQPSEEEITQWINQNIDFSQFKNKMLAMKPIMGHFAGMADGNVVKKILENL